jgi:transcriptional regulator with XRE-family HTH domain
VSDEREQAAAVRSIPFLPRQEPISIGPRLRGARRARGLTIQQVAQATGLTKGFLSRLERDGTTASVASLVRVCDVLGIRVGTLFDQPPSALVRDGEARRINFGGENVRDYLYTPTGEQRLHVLRSHMEPGGNGGEDLYTLASEAEFVYVLAGELEVRVGQQTYRLGEGDGLTFSAREPHTWRNPSDSEDAVALWVLSPAP